MPTLHSFPDFKRFEACLDFLSVGSSDRNVRTKGTSEQKAKKWTISVFIKGGTVFDPPNGIKKWFF